MRGYLFLSDLITAHEPGCPLTRPAGTLSPAPSGGEGRERGRFMGSLLSLLRMDLDHEPAAQPIPLLQDHPLPQWGRGMG